MTRRKQYKKKYNKVRKWKRKRFYSGRTVIKSPLMSNSLFVKLKSSDL